MKGVGEISYSAALALAERGTYQDIDGVRWRSDRRLRIPSPVRLTEAQIYIFCQAITAPVALILGDKGFLVDRESTRLRKDNVARIVEYTLPGNHHLHLEPETADAVADLLIAFWLEPSPFDQKC